MVTITSVHSVDEFLAEVELIGNTEAALEHMADAMADEAVKLAREGFVTGTDPWGTPWHAPHNLYITGGISNFGVELADHYGFAIMTHDVKASWHHAPQSGHLPTRRIVPVGIDVPPAWTARINAAAFVSLRKSSGF